MLRIIHSTQSLITTKNNISEIKHDSLTGFQKSDSKITNLQICLIFFFVGGNSCFVRGTNLSVKIKILFRFV